jgi:hypothetical protein
MVQHRGGEAMMDRLVGLALVLLAMLFFFGLTIPGLMGPWYSRAVLGTLAVGGVLFGMPLLVTGRLRQRR